MINMYFQIASFFYMLMLLIVFFAKNRIKNFETDIFSMLSITNMIGIIIDIVLIFFGYYDPYNSLVYLLNRFYLSYITVWVSLFSLYIFKITISSEFKDKYNKKIDFIYLITTIISIFFIFVLSLKLYNNNGVMYSYGNAIMVVVVNCIIHVILLIILVLKNIKKLSYHKYIPILVLILLCLFALLVRSINPGLLLTTFIITFINVIMYFTIENPDVKLIEQLNIAKNAAEKANRAKSDFLSSMSHEIRTPLNAIVGFSDCILEENTLEEAKNDAKDIKLASQNLLEIVNGILDISKIEADKMEIVETNYNVVETLENVAKLVSPRIEEKPIEFNISLSEDLPHILYGDGGKLRQIVTNILTNAAKYTESGKINFQAKCVNEENFSTLVISVEDTGRGIKPEQIDKLFTKFERLEEDRNTTLEGTGLGLAITKRFVEMMGGKIVVQSKYGSGSRFTIYIKQKIIKMNKDQTEEQAMNTAEIKLFDFSKAKILVVDDNKVNIKVAKKLLSNYDIIADEAMSGKECLDKIKQGNIYDLILLDDMMPGMSGVDTLKEIIPILNSETKVIALTANALTGSREKYIGLGFNDYLSKPIEKPELYRVLLTYLTDKLSRKDTRKKVLIVDDNKINIRVAEKLLSTYDILEVDSCLSGGECLEKVKTCEYDLIFMDIMMPEMDGIETLKHLREMNYNKPVVTLTADAVEGSREKYINLGFDEYISKPLNKEIMDTIIDNFLS